ncbi:MAG: folate-binding protein [Pseudomonadota bacterium]|nr:folate-binding protein [Pseudomonadota bacterium]
MNTPFRIDGAVLLSHWGVIRARGADATKFLQSQLTNDVSALGSGEARLAGFCSAKGRLQASFIVWTSGADEVLLACAASVLPATLKRLSMFVLRAQCKLSDATAEVPLWGVAGPSAQRLVGHLPVWGKRDDAPGALIRLPAAADFERCIVAAPPSQEAPAALSMPLDSWRWLEVSSGIPLIEAATVDQFVPQMLNFEILGGVDFQKGCYPGQEIVARSQYRGTVKRRMFLFDCAALAAAGQEVFHSADPGQPAGMVVNAAPGPQGGSSALIETKLVALEGGELHLGSADGAVLRSRELPYAVTQAA